MLLLECDLERFYGWEMVSLELEWLRVVGPIEKYKVVSMLVLPC